MAGYVTLSIFLVLFHVIFITKADDCPANREQALHDEAKLHKDLFCAYNADFRPVKSHKNAVNVQVRFAVKYISFDSLEETFALHSWVALSWKDEFLSWTPSDYGSITETQVESHEIWTPKMALFNADASLYQSDSFYTTCSLSHDGSVICVPHLVHSGICRTSLKRWPYDSQNCTLYFGSWMHTGEQVNFTFYKKQPVILDDYQNGPGWRLLNVVNKRLPGKYSCCPNTTYPMLKYTFVMEREAAGPAAIVVVPSVVIVVLTLSSLLLDVKDNIRLLLTCFSLFGHFIFLTEIGYDIPKHSADTPIILLFVRDSMIITLCAIVATLVMMSIRRRSSQAPRWIVNVNRLLSSGPGKYMVFTEFSPSEVVAENKVLNEDYTGPNPEEGHSNQNSNTDWIQFANFLNSCIFVISFLVYIILFISYVPYGD